MVAKAVETKHFDRKALSIVRGLEAMSDNKLQVTLPHLLMYIDALELAKRAERQGQLIADAKVGSKAGGGSDNDGTGEMDADDGETNDAPSLQVMPKEDEYTPMH